MLNSARGLLPVLAAAALSGCALQAPYAPPTFDKHVQWENQQGKAHSDLPLDEKWWSAFNDPVLDGLIDTAFEYSPSLALAAAHVRQARATLGVQRSLDRPHLTLTASGGRARVQGDSTSGSGTTQVGSSLTGGPTLNWEIDLFGRLRESRLAASRRLDARTADALASRLLVSSQVAGALISVRSCQVVLELKRDDIASRQRDLELTRRRVELGFAAPVDASRALSGVADAEVGLIAQDEICVKDLDALMALTGLPANELHALVDMPQGSDMSSDAMTGAFPKLPPAVLAVPALVLAHHPDVISAEREVAASYAEVGVARAERLPVLNLSALLSGNWISVSGSSLSFLSWSLMSGFSAPIFDAGAGAATVDAATASYLGALASLRAALVNASQNIEDALTQQAHARQRRGAAERSRDAAQATLDATQAQWQAGAVSLFQLEDTRRLHEASLETAVDAARADVQSWVDIVRASGNAATLASTSNLLD